MTELEATQLRWTKMQIRNEPWKIGFTIAGLVIASMGAGAAVLALMLRLSGHI